MPTRTLLFVSTAVGVGRKRDYGGGEHFASEFLQCIGRNGWRIILACPPCSPLWRDAGLQAVIAERIPLDFAVKVTNPVKFVFVLGTWLWRSRRFPNAVIYANTYESMKWAVAAARFSHQPVVCHLHESTYGPYRSRRARSLAPRVDRFLAISKDVRKQFVDGTGIDPSKVAIVHNGIHVAANVEKPEEERRSVRREFQMPEDARLVMMAARTDIHKGHMVLLEAIGKLPTVPQPVRFLIAGLQNESPDEASLFSEVTRWIADRNLGDVIKYIGYTPHVRKWMRAADIVVVPSTSEGFGRTAIEGMAEKTAVVASRVGGLAEIISHENDGMHFPPGNSEALSEVLRKLLTDDELRARLAANGYRTAREKFSIGSMCRKIEEQLEIVLLNHGIA